MISSYLISETEVLVPLSYYLHSCFEHCFSLSVSFSPPNSLVSWISTMALLKLSLFLLLSPISLSYAASINRPQLEDRETACIALGDCPGENPPDPTTTAPPPPPPATSSAAATPTPSAAAVGFPIKKGYVAFGDSYAAGIGSGTTEGDGCRKGSYSYPRQLAAMATGDIDFQNLPCSGAVVGEVLQGGDKSQIDAWTNPGNADIATLSIGGNDIGFYPILTACVLRVGQSFAGDCDAAVASANSKISGFDLYNDISSALQQIIEKSGRDDFKIYLTGYPAFFNVDTASCDYSTFYYWQPGHHAFHRIGNWAYLYQALRVQLNNLVSNLNTMLSHVANSVNSHYDSQRVWYVDPNPNFDGHRFCEKDGDTEVTEPDENRLDTWLFLSAWPDNSLEGSESAQDANNEEMNAVVAGNSTALPDPNTCDSTLGQSNDWADRILCDTAKAVAAGVSTNNATGPSLASGVSTADQQALADGDYSAVEVPWYVPTRQAKTFHPRTLGHEAYKRAIMAVW